MVKAKIVSVKELTDAEENPSLCLSPLRVFNECHKCERYQRIVKKYLVKGYSLQSIIRDKLKCKPHLQSAYNELLIRKRKLLDELSEVDKAIDQL